MEKYRLEEEHMEAPGPTPCSKEVLAKARPGCSGPCPAKCRISPRTEVPPPLILALSVPLIGSNFSLTSNQNFPCCNVCLLSHPCASQRRVHLCLLSCSSRQWWFANRSHCSPVFFKLNKPSSLHFFPKCPALTSPGYLCDPVFELFSLSTPLLFWETPHLP